jgi:hypothetical protein
MLKKEYRVYLEYRSYLLRRLADATKLFEERYRAGHIHALEVALEEHDRLFRVGQPV